MTGSRSPCLQLVRSCRIRARRERGQFEAGGGIVADSNSCATRFVRRDELGILPVAALDAVPRKGHVIARWNAFELESPIHISGVALVQIRSSTPGEIGQQRDGDVGHWFTILIHTTPSTDPGVVPMTISSGASGRPSRWSPPFNTSASPSRTDFTYRFESDAGGFA